MNSGWQELTGDWPDLVFHGAQGCRSSCPDIYKAASFRQLWATSAANPRAGLFARTATAGVSAAHPFLSATVLTLIWTLCRTTSCASETPGGWATKSLKNLVSETGHNSQRHLKMPHVNLYLISFFFKIWNVTLYPRQLNTKTLLVNGDFSKPNTDSCSRVNHECCQSFCHFKWCFWLHLDGQGHGGREHEHQTF